MPEDSLIVWWAEVLLARAAVPILPEPMGPLAAGPCPIPAVLKPQGLLGHQLWRAAGGLQRSMQDSWEALAGPPLTITCPLWQTVYWLRLRLVSDGGLLPSPGLYTYTYYRQYTRPPMYPLQPLNYLLQVLITPPGLAAYTSCMNLSLILVYVLYIHTYVLWLLWVGQGHKWSLTFPAAMWEHSASSAGFDLFS